MNIFIRKAIKNDVPYIIKLLKNIANLHNNGRPDIFKRDCNKYNKREIMKLIRSNRYEIFVATNEADIVIGYCICEIIVYRNEAVLKDSIILFVDDFCVDENIRGVGVGKLLFNEVENYAKKIGATSIDLNVWQFNEAAYSFYEKYGFKIKKFTMEKTL